jgi:hypothetical protein
MALCRMQREYSAQEGEDAWEWWVRGCLEHARLDDVHLSMKKEKRIVRPLLNGADSAQTQTQTQALSHIPTYQRISTPDRFPTPA